MKWIISNLKNEIVEKSYPKYIKDLKNDNVKIIICPNNQQLSSLLGDDYYLGSQDVNDTYNVQELIKMNVEYSIVGHSDKRKNQGETNREINTKIQELLKNNICPILCIGEDEPMDPIFKILSIQLEDCLRGVITTDIMIAYEPNWAIGTGIIPNLDRLTKILQYIREKTKDLLGIYPILLYGGSVNKHTILSLEQIKLLDGYLIGSASLNTHTLKEIIEVIK